MSQFYLFPIPARWPKVFSSKEDVIFRRDSSKYCFKFPEQNWNLYEKLCLVSRYNILVLFIWITLLILNQIMLKYQENCLLLLHFRKRFFLFFTSVNDNDASATTDQDLVTQHTSAFWNFFIIKRPPRKLWGDLFLNNNVFFREEWKYNQKWKYLKQEP